MAYTDGAIVPIDKVKDEVFAQKTLGDGIAIDPTNGNFYAPISGKIITVLPHAYGIRHKSGVEMLLHIGLDTVELQGKGFTSKVAMDDKVNAGDLLVTVDLKAVKAKVPSMQSPLVIMPNTIEGKVLNFNMDKKKVKIGDMIGTIS